jgi:hypothetical protein
MASIFTNLVRSLPNPALAAVLRARPDLVVPVPADLTALAARAQSRTSVTRIVDRLNRFQLEILDGVRLTRDPDGASSLDQLLAIAAAAPAGADAGSIRAEVGQLRDYLLVYGPDEELRVVAAVDEVLGPYPAGLGRPAAALSEEVAALVGDPARLRRTVLSAPPAARAVLDRLAAGPPVGATAADQRDDPTADSPAAWLVGRGLLVATAAGSVELPREIGLLLRRDTGPLGQLHPLPPQPAGEPLDPATVDQAGAGQAMAAVQRVEAILAALAAEPATVLRTGGLGVRELRRLARAAGVDEPTAALLIETGYAAGLLGEADPSRPGSESSFRPTPGYDAFTGAPLAARWHTLVTSWLVMTRQPGLIGRRDPRDRLVNALAPEVARPGAPAARRAVLGVLADLPPGTAATDQEVFELVRWFAPRSPAGREPAVQQVLAEAATLGLTGRAALTSYGATLLAQLWEPATADDDPLGIRGGDLPAGLPKAAAALAGLLPAPVAELVVQADLTVVVPGPPEPTLAAELELVAEPESAGGGSVHRVTKASIRRALDAGYTADDLHALFARRSRAAVPQALSYLIDDVARAHGGLRIGAAGTYLRSDDEALVAQALADRRLAALQLRRLAPTVLVSTADRGRLLAALRQAGYAPVPEDASGAPVLVRPRVRRAPARPRPAAPADPFGANRMSTPRLLGIIEDLRRSEAAAQTTRRVPEALRSNGKPPRGQAAAAHTDAMAVLQQAVRDKALVWVRYVDAHGSLTDRLVRPVSIGAGYLRAEDDRTDTLHTFALHRITGATLDQ